MDEIVEIMARGLDGYRFKLPGAGGLRGELSFAPAHKADIAKVILSTIRAAGYRVVPEVPTEAMLEAFSRVTGIDYTNSIADGYTAMLSAAPGGE